MQVEEVHFNHAAGGTTDALNLRASRTGPVIAAPEWRRGAAPLPALYASATVGSTITIKARFSGGPNQGAVRIRAIDADLPITEPSGCLGALIAAIVRAIRALFGNALGDVGEQQVAFTKGVSGLVTFSLAAHRLRTCGVSKRTTRWRWQRFQGGSWVDFDKTEHTTYVVLDLPRGPWEQTAGSTQLPWVDALDKSCAWALGATTKDAAAEKITKAVNGQTIQRYTPATTFGFSDYQLTAYLAALNAGAVFSLNCTDCADAVVTFANLLGCDLFEGRFFDMHTRRFLGLSGRPEVDADWVDWSWNYHEIGWLEQMGVSEYIYDGCLQVDMDDDDADTVHVARHPVKMRFGDTLPDDYRRRLVESGTASLENQPRRRALV